MSTSRHIKIVPDPKTFKDARGRISYNVYDNLDTLSIEIHEDMDKESLNELEAKCQGRRITLPTPFPPAWKDVSQDATLIVHSLEISTLSNHGKPFSTSMSIFRGPETEGVLDVYLSKNVHPHVAPVPWFPEQICDARDYTGPRFPEGVEDRSEQDAGWDQIAQDLNTLSYDQVPHWTVRFASPEVAVRRCAQPLPFFDQALLGDGGISELLFFFDATRVDYGACQCAISEIMKSLLARRVRHLELQLRDALVEQRMSKRQKRE